MGRNYVHSLKSSSRIFIYFVVSLEEVWESVLHIFLKARLLALILKKKPPGFQVLTHCWKSLHSFTFTEALGPPVSDSHHVMFC